MQRVSTNTLCSNLFLLCRFCFFESKALLQCWSECSQSWWKENPCSWASAHSFLPPLPLLSPKVAFRCKISRHMERRSFSSPPKDSDCMTNHVHHHPPNPTQNLQTTASLEWKKEFLQLCRVKLRLLSLLNYSIVGWRFKLLHSKPYGWFEHLQVMPSPEPTFQGGCTSRNRNRQPWHVFL